MTEREDKPRSPASSKVGGTDLADGDERFAPVSSKTPTIGGRGRRLIRHALVFITLLIVVDAIAGEKGLLALLQARREYSALERSLDRARTENAELREMARRLREDPKAIEEQARRELGLIKPGEMLFIIKDIEKKP
jgi:cell division protein FtsB